MIELRSVNYRYPQSSGLVLRDIDLRIEDGEILTILGPNGSGKSTLLKLLRGALKPSSGSVALGERAVHSLAKREIAQTIAVVPQRLPRAFSFPVREVVAMGRFARRGFFGRRSADDATAIDWALKATDSDSLAQRSIMHISGGELQRVLLARALAQETPLLLLDEAASHLDLNHRLDMVQMLKRLNRERNSTIIQVSHDFDLSAALSQRILMLNPRGEMVALGSPRETITAHNIKTAFGVDVRINFDSRSESPRVEPIVEL